MRSRGWFMSRETERQRVLLPPEFLLNGYIVLLV